MKIPKTGQSKEEILNRLKLYKKHDVNWQSGRAFSYIFNPGDKVLEFAKWLGSRLTDYRLERTVSIYGVVTGTVSSALMLLRIVDPELKTPVAREIGFMSLFAVPVVGGLTCLLNAPFWWDWSVWVTCLVLGGILLAALIFLLNRELWKNND